MKLGPVTLEGRVVRLEPLSRAHVPGLALAARDPEIWKWIHAPITDEASVGAWADAAMADAERGVALPFAIVDRASGRPLGSTRYFEIRPEHRGLEIGHTWLAREVWRTAVNTECKLLLLRHAFEALGCIRVQLKTNALNARSRAAIERIGGTFEGVLRKHMIGVGAREGIVRDTAMYSITDDEWPEVKARLTRALTTTAAGAECRA